MPFRRNKDSHAHDREFDGLYDDHDPGGHSDPPGSHPIGSHDDDPLRSEFEFDDAPRRRRGCWWTAGCLIPVVVVSAVGVGAYLGYQHLLDNFGSPECEFTANNQQIHYSPEKSANAATIIGAGVTTRGLPSRAGQVAIATAITESKLRNLTYGDLDSLGLFQQRPSQGWGTAAQIQDPVYASNAFYNKLVSIPSWRQDSIAVAAQTVQRSGYPSAYEQHVTAAQTITASLDGTVREAVTCRLEDATTSSSPGAVVAKMAAQTGLRATANASDVSLRARSTQRAWAVAGWAVAHAEAEGITSVTVGDRMWKRERGRGGASWHTADRSAGNERSVRITLAGR